MKTRKFTALLLVLCLLLTATPYSAPVRAVEEEHLAQEQPQEQTQTKLIDAPLLAEGTDLPTRANSNFFKYVDEAVFEAGNHVARIPEEETLSTYVFRNNDGTKTVYYLPDNVKYFAQDGTVVEKDLTLVAKTGGYGVSRSDIDYLLPTSAASGIRLQHGAKEVTLIPQAQSGRVAAAAISGDSVRYANYFGSGIHLVYTPLPSGLKEDIVLERYTGQHSFTFTLNTNGMRPYMQDNQYYLATSADSEERIYLGDVVVYDAKGEPSPGTLTITTVTMGQQYQITVSADPAFLTNPNTEYPVTIDPSLTISDSDQAGAIEDASIYGNKPTVNAGAWTYNHCGYYTSSSTVYGVSRTVYRLAGLISDATWTSIDPADIVSAKLYVKEASGTAGATINLHALTNTTWTETGVNWNNIGDYNTTTVYASSAPGYGAWGEWDITGLARAWKYLTRNINAGFILVSADETANSKTLYASEYGTVDRRPYFTVTYNFAEKPLNYTSKDLDKGSSFQLYWTGVTSTIEWTSSNTAIATVSNTGLVTGVNPGTATITASADGYVSQICTVHVLFKEGVYYINASYGISLGTGGVDTSNQQLLTYTYIISGPSRYYQLWEIKYISSGKYCIRSFGNENLILYRNGNNVVTYHVSSSASVPICGQWAIEYTANGYKILNDGSSSYALTVDGLDTYPGKPVMTSSYSSSSAQMHWDLETTPENYKYKLLALNENFINRNDYFVPVSEFISDYLGADIYYNFYSSMSFHVAIRLLASSEIFIIHTHGFKEGFYISSSTALTMSRIANVDLSNLRFALLLTCNSAMDFSDTNITNNSPGNMVEQMVCSGAETVMGFSEITYVSDCNLFAESFFEATLVNGDTVSAAIINMDYADYAQNMSEICEIGGNKNLVLSNLGG